jgi:hypothetical protein
VGRTGEIFPKHALGSAVFFFIYPTRSDTAPANKLRSLRPFVSGSTSAYISDAAWIGQDPMNPIDPTELTPNPEGATGILWTFKLTRILHRAGNV